ncbi:hypothetical protein BDW_12980 [Bdellovibrio bacteriovorus W]|nr:hypothetical protein BDW_12980 [Bdellovibrio bacteriovorus W]
MKKLFFSVLPLVAFFSSPAHALISQEQQKVVLDIINSQAAAGIKAQQIRCSVGNKLCLVKFEIAVDGRKVGCMVDSLRDESDILQNSKEKGLSLSPYFHSALEQCLQRAL